MTTSKNWKSRLYAVWPPPKIEKVGYTPYDHLQKLKKSVMRSMTISNNKKVVLKSQNYADYPPSKSQNCANYPPSKSQNCADYPSWKIHDPPFLNSLPREPWADNHYLFYHYTTAYHLRT